MQLIVKAMNILLNILHLYDIIEFMIEHNTHPFDEVFFELHKLCNSKQNNMSSNTKLIYFNMQATLYNHNIG